MSRRKKIIIFSIIAIVIIAVVWFFVQRSKNQKVQSQNGNVSSLFPFTGTNTADYQTEPGGTAPSNDYSKGGYGTGGSTGSGNGSGNNGTGGGANGTGVTNILNLNDLQVGSGGIGLGLNGINGGGGGIGNGNGGNGYGSGGSCTGDFCPGTPCPECLNPYYGQITLKANGVSSANLTSEGGIVELAWTVGNGAPLDQLNTVCTANSSNGTWTGTKIPNEGPDTLNISPNNTSSIISTTYTISCTGIGSASATVNESSSLTNGFIAGSSIRINASYGTSLNKQSVSLPANGGQVNLAWTVTLPSTYTGDPVVSCIASSSKNDWNGGTSMPGSISSSITATSSVTITPNNGDSIVSNTYTITCDHVGSAIATVNVDSITHGGIIAGSSIRIVASSGSTLNKQSINLPANGGLVSLAWTVTLPSTYNGNPVVSCIASSSKNDWNGGTSMPTSILSTRVSTSTVNEPSNTTDSIVSNTYTITCDHVGSAVATVNISPVASGGVLGIIPGSSISIAASLDSKTVGKQSLQVPANGGDVYLTWTATLPSTYTGGALACRATSSDNDWSGGLAMPDTISSSTSQTSKVTEPANNGNDNITKTYSIECDRIGKATASVYITSLLGGGIIKGSSIIITVATSTTALNPRYTIAVPTEGGDVYLTWTATLPSTFNNVPSITCVATSSAGDWSGNTTITPFIGTNRIFKSSNNKVTELANISSNIITNTYTIKCNNIGSASAVVNVKPSKANFGVINDYFTFTVNQSFTSRLSSDGGAVTLAWNIYTDNVGPTHGSITEAISTSTTISNPNGPNCTATSSASDWTGIKNYRNDGSGSQSVSIPPNTSTSTKTRSYTLSCVGLGVKTVTVNTNISPYANANRTPKFKLLVDGATRTTVAPGTPVNISWDVKNIDANTCKGTSTGTTTDGLPDGPFSGWGVNNERSQDPLTNTQKADLANFAKQLADAKAALAVLTATTSTVSTSTVVATIKNQINVTKGQIADKGLLITNTDATLLTTQSNISANNTTISNLNSQLITKKSLLNSLNSHLEAVQAVGLGALTFDAIPSLDKAQTTSQIGLISNDITAITGNLTTVTNNQKVLNTTFSTQKTNLNILKDQTVALQGNLSNLQTQLNDLQTQTQIDTDLVKATQIKNLEYQINTLQAQIDAINNRPEVIHPTIVVGGSIKAPFVDIGTVATSFTETVGADDSLNGGLLDVPITGQRTYTLTCGKLPPQSVVIKVSKIQGNNESTQPSLEFTGNDVSSPTINVGETVDLTWKVSNILGNSCYATGDGRYPGWGYSYQKIRHVKKADGTIVDGATYVLKPGDFEFFTNDLIQDIGGTLKAPNGNVGTSIQSFTETVGGDIPITSTRTYTLSCGKKTQKVTINVENKPVLSFMVNGQRSDNVSTGATADLTWEVKNIKAGSCKGTSTGFTGAGAGGNFPGWGSDYIANKPKNFNFNKYELVEQSFNDVVAMQLDGGGDLGVDSKKVIDTLPSKNNYTMPAYNISAEKSFGTSPAKGISKLNLDVNVQNSQTLYGAKTEFYTIAGGTPKEPKKDLGGVTQKFTETIGKDGSIMDGIERDYTLTCESILDGSPVFQTIVINGPNSINANPNTITPNNPLATSPNPCDNDLDIKSAQIQLTNLVATYRTLTGYSIGNFGNGSAGDDPAFYDPTSNLYRTNTIVRGTDFVYGATSTKFINSRDSAPGLIDQCWSETTRNPDVAKSFADQQIDLAYVFEPNTRNQNPTANALTRLFYDQSLLPYAKQEGWLNPWPVDGGQNPLQGWVWADKPENDYHNYHAWSDGSVNGIPYKAGDVVDHEQVPDSSSWHEIWIGDLANQIIIHQQNDPWQIGRMWLSGDMSKPKYFDTSERAHEGEFHSGQDMDTDGRSHSWLPGVNEFDPQWSPDHIVGKPDTGIKADYSNKVDFWPLGKGTEFEYIYTGTGNDKYKKLESANKDDNNIYFYLKRRENDQKLIGEPGTPFQAVPASGAYVTDGKTFNRGADPATGKNGYFACTKGWPNVTITGKVSSAFGFGGDGKWFGTPFCGPGVLVGKYEVGPDQAKVYYNNWGMESLGQRFGY